MKRWAIGSIFGLLAVATVGSSAAQEIPAIGLTALVCRLGVSGSGQYCAPGGQQQLCLTVADAGGNPGTAVVDVRHGRSGSTHTVIYQDDGDGRLDCGDAILSVQ